MLRTGTTRALTRSLLGSPTASSRHTSTISLLHAQIQSRTRQSQLRRPSSSAIGQYQQSSTALGRYASTHPGTPFDHIDKKHEKDVAKVAIEPHPEDVSTLSSVRQVMHEEGVEDQERDVDMLAGVKSDLKTIRETFSMSEVPREAFVLGMAGVLPYLATSISTVYLAWDINHAALTGSGFLLSGQTAELLLHIIEPLQIGYGAVILSFLGAIHWGLEWAKYGGKHGYPRYAIGVVAPAIAWPTTLLPVEYALIAQFLAFNYLYFADARATRRGWAPHWYTTYRFALTFIVGASIVISLIGRGQIADKINRLPGPADRIKALRDSQMASLEAEEKERRAKLVSQEEDEDTE
ncbi:hypothetical protein MMC34_005782 [Xylographa carneopallida]|nr:hypothetical protein [Xylographa carneopallida]